MLVRGEGKQVFVTEALADRRGSRCGCRSSLEVSACLLPKDQRQEQVARLDAFPSLTVEQALGAAEPAAGPAHLSALGEIDADPKGTAQGRERFTGIQVSVVGALEDAEVVLLAAEHVGSGGKQLQIRRGQLARPIGGEERFVCIRPRLASV
jgi:hypothetical protein